MTSRDMVAGAIAGFTARTISSPFDVIKIRFQLQDTVNPTYRGIVQTFFKIVKEEGILACWKGNLSATYLWVSYAMVQFASYARFKRVSLDFVNSYYPNNSSAHGTAIFVSGAAAGAMSTLCTYPFDIMRTQFAIQTTSRAYSSMYEFVFQTLQTRGFRGFYAGCGPAVIGIVPYMGLNFSFYEGLKKLSDKLSSKSSASSSGQHTVVDYMIGMLSHATCGAIAGGSSKFLVYPFDTVKKRLQGQALVNSMDSHSAALSGPGSVSEGTVQPKYRGMFHCLRTIVKEEGVARGLYKGIVPTCLKSMVGSSVTFATYEWAMTFMKNKDLLS